MKAQILGCTLKEMKHVRHAMAVGRGLRLGAIAPPFPQKKKRFETQLSNKYNMP